MTLREYIIQRYYFHFVSSLEVLDEFFFGCETIEEYDKSYYILTKFKTELYRLSFMVTKSKNPDIETQIVRLKIRLELFKRVPTATNMLLSYNLIEEITLRKFSEGRDISERINKDIERFDKLKNLALSTKYIAERKLAFEKSLEVFKRIAEVIL